MSEFREPMFNRRGKPQIIRKPVKWSNTKLPGGKRRVKAARDYKLGVLMERVTARAPRPCANGRCAHYIDQYGRTGIIAPGTQYAKVHANEGQGRFIKGRMIYSPRDYHFECVPEQYRPLVRFLQP